jgi:hypothetical protein
MSLSARSLPKIRDQVLKQLDDLTMPVRARTGDANQPALDLAAEHLRVAELYWVTADMAALAVSAGGSLAAARWTVADRPTPAGLIVFDGGIGEIVADDAVIPVDAVTWGPEEHGCMLGLWMSRWRLAEAAARHGDELVTELMPPLVPLRLATLPLSDEPLPLATQQTKLPTTVIAALAASWLLMQQPNLVERTTQRPDKSVRRAYGRAGRPDPEVTLVDLRRQYVPSQDDAEKEPSRYRHRWVVSGHWRDQAYGPARSLRQKTWIPAYIKGPDGAPLLATERVNVWRR